MSSPAQRKLWLETPLIPSSHISARLGPQYTVYLKLDNLQPSHSFKFRGLSHFVQHHRALHGPALHVVCASGGNAGLAAACASQAVGVRCTVYLPEGVAASTQAYLRTLGAELVVAGAFYAETLAAAEAAAAGDEKAVLAPAYESPILWEGHASMVEEIKAQLPTDVTPDAIFCDVGGGGLLAGIMVGCKTVGWDDVPIIGLETHGSDCFYQSMLANRQPSLKPREGVTIRHDTEHGVKIAHVHKLTSLATSLGASEPSPGVVKMALERKGNIVCATIPDELCMQAARSFADDHKFLVELACAAALAPAYKHVLLQHVLPPATGDGRKRTLVFIVCGGFKVSQNDMEEYGRLLERDLARGEEWDLMLEGHEFTVPKLGT
ncbi:tryptophan synthase beta subunit-like PLP-dependent enzyme [Artomyces pyxidatus]|uniref:Tryptophan synthase beta subunit-like PLP-dependent enzyme n=1 Tax=Artomyces pyxidatus TaxID=48021 RepID=A0ACB8SWK7_9AGAM|nr:tryptophan synthase beta subunit-like PLP-dependent enzyme [Artomyces pyxidatus]